MSTQLLRVKLEFDSSHTLNEQRKVWFLLDTWECDNIYELKLVICEKYNIHNEELNLYIDNALLADKDPTLLIRENDTITVKFDQTPSKVSSKKKKRPACDLDSNDTSYITTNNSHLADDKSNSYDTMSHHKKKAKYSTLLDENSYMSAHSEIIESSFNYDVERSKEKKKKKKKLESTEVSNSIENQQDKVMEQLEKISFCLNDIMETKQQIENKTDKILNDILKRVKKIEKCTLERKSNEIEVLQNTVPVVSDVNTTIEKFDCRKIPPTTEIAKSYFMPYNSKEGEVTITKKLPDVNKQQNECKISSLSNQPKRTHGEDDTVNCQKKKRRRRRKRKACNPQNTASTHATEKAATETLDILQNYINSAITETTANIVKHIKFSSSSDSSDSCIAGDKNFLSNSVEKKHIDKVKDSLQNCRAVPNGVDVINNEKNAILNDCSTTSLEINVNEDEISKGLDTINSTTEAILCDDLVSLQSSKCRLFTKLHHDCPESSGPGTENSPIKDVCDTNHETNEPVETTDYTTYPEIKVLPKVGTCIAFKRLQLDECYCPVVSPYKVGVIKAIDELQNIEIELLSEEIKETHNGKFENVYPDEEPPMPEVIKVISLPWREVINPRLLQAESV